MLSTPEQIVASTSLSAFQHLARHLRRVEIGSLIRSKRKERGLSQRALGKMLGVTGGAVAQWELGATLPTSENMTALKQLIGLAPSLSLSPGAPYAGQIIEDPDELALLRFWRNLDDPKRQALLDLLHIGEPSNYRDV